MRDEKKQPSMHFAGGGSGVQVAVGCDYDGFRWHLWFNKDQPPVLAANHTLYKNPLNSPDRRHRTAKLDAHAKSNAKLVALLLADAPRQIAEFRLAEAKREAQQKIEYDNRLAEKRLRDAAPELLEALDNVTASLENCLLHAGKPMPKADLTARQQRVAEARALIDRIRPQ